MKDLFGNDIVHPLIGKTGKRKGNASAIKAHANLRTVYGTKEDQRCKNCVHCWVKQFAGKYWKCELAGGTGPAYDWRANWVACGKFELDPDAKNK
jgi:hypothetical protein